MLDAQYRAHPVRFVKGAPVAARPPEVVTINPVTPDEAGDIESLVVNFPTLSAAKARAENTLSFIRVRERFSEERVMGGWTKVLEQFGE